MPRKSNARKVSKTKTRKNPWIALILNIVLWGTGYIYNGKRKMFGVLILLSEVAAIVAIGPNFFSLSEINLPLETMGAVLTVAFALDAYNEAKNINRGR